ncbi:hypothetical protein [Ramlibacter albus]|uniref:Uncharacterized protein n=1 Tax=Ramlibacter albus TaxID=2079448 RepID=A0A923M767_9BURK|nr:hypothetical protein [Ramlibacter albus]MBC5765093.1 hypothetical protein [Ramlibacter albus]
MTYISKAQRQLDGDLLLRTDTQALLYRTVQELAARLQAEKDGRPVGDPTDCLRALTALQDKLGLFHGDLPSVNDLLGDPHREMVARNLLKGC